MILDSTVGQPYECGVCFGLGIALGLLCLLRYIAVNCVKHRAVGYVCDAVCVIMYAAVFFLVMYRVNYADIEYYHVLCVLAGSAAVYYPVKIWTAESVALLSVRCEVLRRKIRESAFVRALKK